MQRFIVGILRFQLTISQLSSTDKTGPVFVKHLETPAVVLWLTRVTETIWSVENFDEFGIVN